MTPERYQRVGRLRLDSGEAAADRTGGADSLHLADERIVAAGVENDQPQPLGRLENAHNALDRDGLVVDVEIALQHHVDRQQVVRAIDLDAVAGVIDDRNVGRARDVGKVPERAAHRIAAHVVLGLDHVEAGIAE